jgi:L-threonylcarbamoyladenylate synthase
MNRISIDARESVEIAADKILSGEIVLYPTDTLYGLGADALSDEAVAQIYAIKGREDGKPIHAIVADMDMAARYGEVNDAARILAKRFLPGPLTLILKKKTGIETGIGKGIDTIGIRIPANDFCKQLVERFGGPITTTSANPSGIMPARTVAAILDQFEDRADMIGLSIDAGELPARLPSTVVDLSGERPAILREGAIPSSEIWEALAPLED